MRRLFIVLPLLLAIAPGLSAADKKASDTIREMLVLTHKNRQRFIQQMQFLLRLAQRLESSGAAADRERAALLKKLLNHAAATNFDRLYSKLTDQLIKEPLTVADLKVAIELNVALADGLRGMLDVIDGKTKGAKPAAPLPAPAVLDRLIAELDDKEFDVREAASLTLLQAGPGVLPHLNAALKKMPPLEARRRIEVIIVKLRPAHAADPLWAELVDLERRERAQAEILSEARAEMEATLLKDLLPKK